MNPLKHGMVEASSPNPLSVVDRRSGIDRRDLEDAGTDLGDAVVGGADGPTFFDLRRKVR